MKHKLFGTVIAAAVFSATIFSGCTQNAAEDFTETPTTVTAEAFSESLTETAELSEPPELPETSETTASATTSISRVTAGPKPTETTLVSYRELELELEPFAADFEDYRDKEIVMAVFFFINRYPLYWTEIANTFSVLLVYADGTCGAAVLTNSRSFPHSINTCNFFDSIAEPTLIGFDILGTLDNDTMENIRGCLDKINFESEYTDHYTNRYDPLQPAVEPDCDAVDYYAVTDNGELRRLAFVCVEPGSKPYVRNNVLRDPLKAAEIELDDEYAKQAADALVDSEFVRYWLVNYAWKIGENE
ncbi:MAG: hypothetical protein K2N60_03190 [Oscillospiraceae bacterium]|nr:hypothetical protein [Oscillospiraceae bacterium]